MPFSTARSVSESGSLSGIAIDIEVIDLQKPIAIPDSDPDPDADSEGWRLSAPSGQAGLQLHGDWPFVWAGVAGPRLAVEDRQGDPHVSLLRLSDLTNCCLRSGLSHG